MTCSVAYIFGFCTNKNRFHQFIPQLLTYSVQEVKGLSFLDQSDENKWKSMDLTFNCPDIVKLPLYHNYSVEVDVGGSSSLLIYYYFLVLCHFFQAPAWILSQLSVIIVSYISNDPLVGSVLFFLTPHL